MERAGDKLDRVLASAVRQIRGPESVLLAWPLACGSAVAERTHARAFTGGVLSVEVSDQAWRRELSILSGRYLLAINKYSSQRVERIEFVISR